MTLQSVKHCSTQRLCAVHHVCYQLLHDPVVTEVASECSRSNAQVLLRWSVQQHIG